MECQEESGGATTDHQPKVLRQMSREQSLVPLG